MPRRWLFTAALALLFGCSPGAPDLPPLPAIDPTTIATTAGRDRLQAALATLQSDPNSAEANGQLGMQLHAADQFALAATLYERARALRPADERWWYYHAAVHARLGNQPDAAASYRATLERNPNYIPARIGLAHSTDDPAAAIALFTQLRDERPDLPTVRYGLGRALVERGDRDAAIPELEKAVALFPGYGPAHYQLGIAYRDAGRDEDSRQQLALYEKDRERTPFAPDPLMAAVDALRTDAATFVRRGADREAAGDIQGALDLHLQAIEADPDFHQAHANLVVLYAKLGDYESAEKAYRTSRGLDSNQAELEYNFGVLAFDAGRMSDAKTAFARALEINPNYAAAHNNMGQMLEEEGRIDSAIGHYRDAIRNRPNYRLAHYHLGRMMMLRKRGGDAIAEFRKTLEPEDASTPQFRFSLAMALAATGQSAEARRQAEQAIALAEKYQQPELAQAIRQRFGLS